MLAQLAETLPQRLEGRPVAVLLFGTLSSTTEPRRSEGVLAAYAGDLERRGRAHRFTIEPLSAEEIGASAGCVPRVAAEIASLTGGWPEYVAAAVAELVAAGHLRRLRSGELDWNPGVTGEGFAPRSLHHWALNRAFDDEAGQVRIRTLRLLQAASQIGEGFISEPLHALAGFEDAEQCRATLDKYLVDRGIALERGTPRDAQRREPIGLVVPYRFRSSLWRATFLGSMTRKEAQRSARSVAGALLAYHEGPPFQVAAIAVRLIRDGGSIPAIELVNRAGQATETESRRARLETTVRFTSENLPPAVLARAAHEIELMCRDLYGSVSPQLLLDALETGERLAARADEPLQGLSCRALRLPNLIRLGRESDGDQSALYREVLALGRSVMDHELFPQLADVSISETITNVVIARDVLDRSGGELLAEMRGRFGFHTDLTIDELHAQRLIAWEGRPDEGLRLAEDVVRRIEELDEGSRSRFDGKRGMLLLVLAREMAGLGDWPACEERAMEADESMMRRGDLFTSLDALQLIAAARASQGRDVADLVRDARERARFIGLEAPPDWISQHD